MKTKILFFFLLLVVGMGNTFAENKSSSILQEIKNARDLVNNWDSIPGTENDKLIVSDFIRYNAEKNLLEHKQEEAKKQEEKNRALMAALFVFLSLVVYVAIIANKKREVQFVYFFIIAGLTIAAAISINVYCGISEIIVTGVCIFLFLRTSKNK